jgi:hypothetical protein
MKRWLHTCTRLVLLIPVATVSAAADLYGPPLITTVDDPSNGNSVGLYTAVTIGGDGLPVIAYSDRSDKSVKVAHCGNPACSAGTVINIVDDHPTADLGNFISIAKGADGFPIIAYYDATNLQVPLCLR